MSTRRTTDSPKSRSPKAGGTARTAAVAARRRAAVVECAMPACTAPRVRGKAYCSGHVPVARERARTAAGDSAWA